MNGLRVLPVRCPPFDLLALHAQHPERYPFLLESSGASSTATSRQTRYDLLLAFPGAQMILANGRLQATGFSSEGPDFLQNLDRWFASEAASNDAGDGLPPDARAADALPFQGGWFIYLGYELAAQIEPVLCLPLPGAASLPTAMAIRCPAAIIYDRQQANCWLVAEPACRELIDVMQEDIRRLKPSGLPAAACHARVEEQAAQAFLDSVTRIREYIHAGDVFQVNLSRRWDVQLEDEVSPADLYMRLRQMNPAPFSASIRWQGHTLLSSSPERLVRSSGGWIETRPIAGTYPRLADEAADRAQAQALLKHPKERAEHIMLLDLERNDLGRICRPGSVEVNESMVLESYAHVHHIVSNIRGRLLGDVPPGRLMRAVFPGGTITGCPKVRCMQIIAELECEGRDFYTGSIGYLDRSGALDLNILIRSLVLRQGRAVLRTGAGIVADSDPHSELEETRAKARGLLRLFGTSA